MIEAGLFFRPQNVDTLNLAVVIDLIPNVCAHRQAILKDGAVVGIENETARREVERFPTNNDFGQWLAVARDPALALFRQKANLLGIAGLRPEKDR